jgi:signal transduction histidine kinase
MEDYGKIILKRIESHKHELILVIDDRDDILRLLGAILKDFKIAYASSAAEGLEKARKLKPALILLDVMMPMIDGFEACRMLKEDPETSDIPVIFVTARIMIDDIIKGLSLGANDYVTKPFDTSELLARVKTHLDLRKARITAVEEYRRIKELNDEKNEFIKIAAHDLRNPLKVVQGFARLIEKKYNILTEDEIKEYLGDISNAAQGMLSIITDILLMNDLDEGLAEPYYQDFDIVQLLRLLIDEHIQHAEIKNIKMNFSSNLIDTYIYSDFIKTKLIFENLISNAIKYTKLDSQVNIDVIYGTDKSSDKYDFRIVVEDYGPGISEFEINHIFDKFCKISNKPTGKEPSTGLGLAITKALCELLNYGIQVETNEKIGTKFIVLLKYNKTTTTINV